MTDSPRTPLDVELYNAGYKSGYAAAEAARLDRDSLCPFCGHSEHLADVCEYDLGESGECRCIDDRYRVMGHVGQIELVDPALYPRTPAEPEWLPPVVEESELDDNPNALIDPDEPEGLDVDQFMRAQVAAGLRGSAWDIAIVQKVAREYAALIGAKP